MPTTIAKLKREAGPKTTKKKTRSPGRRVGSKDLDTTELIDQWIRIKDGSGTTARVRANSLPSELTIRIKSEVARERASRECVSWSLAMLMSLSLLVLRALNMGLSLFDPDVLNPFSPGRSAQANGTKANATSQVNVTCNCAHLCEHAGATRVLDCHRQAEKGPNLILHSANKGVSMFNHLWVNQTLLKGSSHGEEQYQERTPMEQIIDDSVEGAYVNVLHKFMFSYMMPLTGAGLNSVSSYLVTAAKDAKRW